jgi:hypothetical protein
VEEFLISGAAELATNLGRRITVHGLRKLGRLGSGPRREYDPVRRAWIYTRSAVEEWVAEHRAQRTTTPVSQPEWLQSPEVRQKAAEAAAERRRALKGSPSPTTA